MTSSHQCSLRLVRLRLGQLLFLISPTWKGFWSSIGSVYAYFFWRMTGWVWGTERWANIKQQRFEANSGEGERNQQQVRGAAFVLVASNGKVRWGVQQAVRSTSDGHLFDDQGINRTWFTSRGSLRLLSSLLFLLCSLRDCRQQNLGKRTHADEPTAIRIRFTILRGEKKREPGSNC